MITINTYIICSSNYTDINYNVTFENVILEQGNERIAEASTLKEQNPKVLEAKANLIAAKELYYSDKDLNALKLQRLKEIEYQQKYEQHQGKKLKITVNYDYAFANYFQLMVYCLGASDIVNYTETDPDTEVKTAFICVDYLYPQHHTIIQADPNFTIEDLSDFTI